jgi:hypothetical protein
MSGPEHRPLLGHDGFYPFLVGPVYFFVERPRLEAGARPNDPFAKLVRLPNNADEMRKRTSSARAG